MTDLSAIRVIPFSGKCDEWPSWSEKFLAKAKRFGFKDVLLGKVMIPKSTEEFDEESDDGKKKARVIELNEIAYTELILSIDVKNSSGKIAFNLVKGCKSKDYIDGNAALAWERLRNKFEPISAPSMVKLEKQFRQLALQKNQDPEVWLTELEDLRMKLEDMGSSMSDNQFMIHILNNLTSDYELQLALMERRIGDKEKPLTIDEIRDELNLRFERLSMKSASNNESDVLEEQALFSGRFKGVCRNCGMIGHKSVNCNKRRSTNNRFSQENNNNNFSGNNSGSNDRNTLSTVYCTYCNKTGHMKKNCFKLKKRNKQLNNNGGTSNYSAQDRQNFDSTDVAFSATSESDNLQNDIWICDSGACGHYCNFVEGLQDVKAINEEITVGNGKSMVATKVGNLKCRVEQLDGSSLDVTLNEVKYVPDLWINLFSINKALKNGFNLSNKGITICLSKGPVSVSFDRIFPTTNGFVSGIKMSVIHPAIISNAIESFKLKKSVDINQFHKVIGHCGADRLKNTANIYGLKLSGQFQVCEDCAIAKARQKNINKVWTGSSNKPGERVYIDLSSIKEKSFGGAKFWALVVDDCSDYCWSFFLKSKSELKNKIMVLLTDLKIAGINIKFIRCDDSGENKALFEECRSKGIGITFEFSGPRTPQRNGKVERKFQTFYGRIRAMLNGAGLNNHIRNGVWAECAMTVTYLSNIMTTKASDKCPYQVLFGCKPKINSCLKVFGEIGVVTTKQDIQGKLNNRGTPCMFVGYPVNHSSDVFRMLNLKTYGIINSRDVIWLGKLYKDWILNKSTIVKDLDDEDDVLEIWKSKNSIEDIQQSDDVIDSNNNQNKRVYRQLKQLKSWFNPEATKAVEDYEQGRDINLSEANIALISTNLVNEPVSFDEAWNNEDLKEQLKWREAIEKELVDMKTKNVWEIINKSDVPENRRCIKCKWIFKVKRNGVYRARLVACGYSQVPGIDFNESFAPVINDVSFRIMLVAKLVWNLKASIIDVETAFLHGNLKEEIYMDVPPGLNVDPTKCLKLKRTIYGLVQSAREFYKKFTDVLKIIGFSGSKSDPCLWTKWTDNHVILIGIYVDDCLVIGDEEKIKNLVDELKIHGFNLKVEEELVDYLSCRIIENEHNNSILMLQPHLISGLIEKFGLEVKDKKMFKTPGTPRFKVIRSTEDMDLIDEKMQSKYRSGVGMLLYLTKYSRPDICNVVRELSKCVDGATIGTYLEMLRVIKFVIDTKTFGLKMSPKIENQNWTLKVFCDSDWAGDPETRISVTGFIIYLLNVPICWRSKGQRGVTLSSSEAEYVAISEAAKEIKFIFYLLKDIGVDVQLPIVVKTDNIGALFMSQNASTGVRTRHIDTRYHFIREIIDDGLIKIEFVRSKENDSDIFTKNVNQETYERHVKNFLGTEEIDGTEVDGTG